MKNALDQRFARVLVDALHNRETGRITEISITAYSDQYNREVGHLETARNAGGAWDITARPLPVFTDTVARLYTEVLSTVTRQVTVETVRRFGPDLLPEHVCYLGQRLRDMTGLEVDVTFDRGAA